MNKLLSVGETQQRTNQADIKKPVKMGLDFIRDQNQRPIKRTRNGACSLAEKIAKKDPVRNFWHGDIADCGEYYRISLCGHRIN